MYDEHASGVDVYSYVGGNPISYVDPLGLDKDKKAVKEIIEGAAQKTPPVVAEMSDLNDAAGAANRAAASYLDCLQKLIRGEVHSCDKEAAAKCEAEKKVLEKTGSAAGAAGDAIYSSKGVMGWLKNLVRP